MFSRKYLILCITEKEKFCLTSLEFQLELIYYFTYFSPSSHPTLVCFFPVGLSLLIQHFQQVLFSDLNSNCPSQETEETSTPIRPVENVILTMKGLQERNNNC